MKKALVVGVSGLVALAAVAIWMARSPDNDRTDQSSSRRVDRILYNERSGVIPEE